MVKESLKNFCEYSASDEELFMYIRINAGEWNEESFVKMKKLVREVIKDYENEGGYPKIFIRYFVFNIPCIINILSNFKGCTDKELHKGYTVESYLSMIAERIKELKKLEMEFQNSLWAK